MLAVKSISQNWGLLRPCGVPVEGMHTRGLRLEPVYIASLGHNATIVFSFLESFRWPVQIPCMLRSSLSIGRSRHASPRWLRGVTGDSFAYGHLCSPSPCDCLRSSPSINHVGMPPVSNRQYSGFRQMHVLSKESERVEVGASLEPIQNVFLGLLDSDRPITVG